MNLDDLTPEEEMTLRLAALYEQTNGIEDFAFTLGLDAGHPDTIELYERVHSAYTQVWTFLGEEEFGRAMDDRQGMRSRAHTLLFDDPQEGSLGGS